MSVRCPFDPLVAARRARRDGAMKVVVRHREIVARHEAERDLIRSDLDALASERAAARDRLVRLAASAGLPVDLTRSAARAALLAARMDEMGAELMAAERRLEAARNDLAEAVQAFFKANAKFDALERRKREWLRGNELHRERIEEAMTEDLVIHRSINSGR